MSLYVDLEPVHLFNFSQGETGSTHSLHSWRCHGLFTTFQKKVLFIVEQ